jgi:hypothetical protein
MLAYRLRDDEHGGPNTRSSSCRCEAQTSTCEDRKGGVPTMGGEDATDNKGVPRSTVVSRKAPSRNYFSCFGKRHRLEP